MVLGWVPLMESPKIASLPGRELIFLIMGWIRFYFFSLTLLFHDQLLGLGSERSLLQNLSKQK